MIDGQQGAGLEVYNLAHDSLSLLLLQLTTL